MLPEAQCEDLLYVTNISGYSGGDVTPYGSVTIYMYPQGKLVGKLTGFSRPNGLCVDAAGNVFVTDFGYERIIEYPHGGTVPIRTLKYLGTPNGCAVDLKTGALAVAISCDGPIGSCYPSGTVLIFRHAKGRPLKYQNVNSPVMLFCTYDKAGNLFVDGTGREYTNYLDELPVGGSRLGSIAFTFPRKAFAPGGLQWHGKYLAITMVDGNVIYQYSIAGSNARLVRSIPLKSIANGNGTNQFWIGGKTIVAEELSTVHSNGMVKFFRYPTGGKPTRIISKNVNNPWAASISCRRGRRNVSEDRDVLAEQP